MCTFHKPLSFISWNQIQDSKALILCLEFSKPALLLLITNQFFVLRPYDLK